MIVPFVAAWAAIRRGTAVPEAGPLAVVRSRERRQVARGSAHSSRPHVARSLQTVPEEGRELVEGDQGHAVVEVDVARALNQEQFLRLGGPLVRVLAELLGVRQV